MRSVTPRPDRGEERLLELIDVSKDFLIRSEGRKVTLSAVNQVSLQVRRGTTTGVVGESGCGKSTLARLITGLHKPSGGEMAFEGKQIETGRRARSVAEQMQMVFQDPSSALNPRSTIGESVALPLRCQRRGRQEIQQRVADVLGEVGLPASYAGHYPHQLSGGQRQRVNIARALVLRPKLVVLDEAVSALDKSIQAQVLNLLSDLQQEHGLTYIFISHDLNVIEYMSDDVVVMYLGQVVEQGPASRIYANPLHPYTQLLLSSTPAIDPAQSTRDEPLDMGGNDIPSPLAPPSGCRFRTRCPFAMEICATTPPTRVEPASGGSVACHLYGPEGIGQAANRQ